MLAGVNRQLGLSDELFVLGDSVILMVLGQVGGVIASCFARAGASRRSSVHTDPSRPLTRARDRLIARRHLATRPSTTQVSFMPILVLAARLCPEGVEATLFATLMSILNGGSFVGSALGAGLTSSLGVTSSDFGNLFLLLALCNVSTLLPAPFLWLLPAALDAEGPPSSGKDKGGGGSDGGGGSSGSDAEVLQQQAPRPQRRRQQQTAAALGAGADAAGSVVLSMQALLGGGGGSSSRGAAGAAWGSRSSGGSDDGDGGEQRPLLAPHGLEEAGSKAV